MPVKNDAGERGDQDRAGERGADRDAEVRGGVLEAADLAALLVGHRRHRHRAELRRERADAEPGEEHRPGDDLRTGAGVERGDEHDEADEQHDEAELGDPPRRRVREHLRDPDRGDHQRDRQREDPDAGVDRREPERDREEQRHREEQAGLEQVLEEERDEAAPQQRDPQDRRVEQRRPGRCRGGASPRRGTRAAPTPPPRISQITGDRPSHVGASGFGCTNPQVPERRIP